MKIKRILLAVLALLLVFAMCFAMVGCDKDDDKKDKKSSSSRSPEDVADDYMEAMFVNRDAKEILDLIHDDVIDAACEDEEMTKSEFEDYLQEEIDYTFDALDDEVDEWSVDWEISYVEDMDEYDLEDLQEDYLDMYDLEVDDAKFVEIDATIEITVDDETEDSGNDMEICVVKIDGKWYLDPDSMENVI